MPGTVGPAVTTTPSWFSVAPPPGGFKTPAAGPFNVLPNELNTGVTLGLLTVSAINVLSEPVAVQVGVSVSAPLNWITVDTSGLQAFSFSLLDPDTLPSSQQINVTSLIGGQPFFTTTHVDGQTGNWLLASPTQGTVPSAVG